MTYYPIRLPIKAWQYLGDGFGAQSFPALEGLENFPKSITFQKLTDKTFHALFDQEVYDVV